MKYKKILYENNKLNFVMTIISSFILMACNVYVAMLLMELIDAASEGGIEDLKWLIVKSLVFVLVSVLAGFVDNFFKIRFSCSALRNFKGKVFERMLQKNINAFDANTTSKYISVFNNDIKAIELNYVDTCPTLVQQASLLIGGIAAMIYLNPILSVCVLVSLCIPIFVTLLFGNKVAVTERKVSDSNSKFTECVKDMISGFAVIKNFKAEEEVQEIFNNSNQELEDTKKKRKSSENIIGILTGCSGNLVLIIVFAIGAYMSIQNIINIGMVVAFIQLLNYVVGPIQQIPVLVSKMRAANKIIIKIEDEIENQKESTGDKTPDKFENAIELKDITYSYDKDKVILDHISFKFERGKSYALVGASGSGKSTLLKLLLGYMSDYTGELSLDGIPLNEIKTESLYDLMVLIQQSVIIFDDSLNANISMFKPFDDNEINQVIQMSGLINVVQDKGKDYKCGENGNNLSGGEKQRVAIARALLRKTPIILMDEATAALDNSTAYAVENEIINLEDVTKIVVTHKINRELLVQYDQILMLYNGKIEECGTYDELWNKKGKFYSLCNMSDIE